MVNEFSVHSDFLIHWTGEDIDRKHDPNWYTKRSSKTKQECTKAYVDRLESILEYGLWMTVPEKREIQQEKNYRRTPRTCFTELKLSESRSHADKYGRLGIGVKRPFVIKRMGRPVLYYDTNIARTDWFRKQCYADLEDKSLLKFFKPMNSKKKRINYDLFGESEWRIIFNKVLLSRNYKSVVNPRNRNQSKHFKYYETLSKRSKQKLKYLLPLDSWLAMIIYPSLQVKNKAQSNGGIVSLIKKIKGDKNDPVYKIEGGNWPIELCLDDCVHF